MKVDKVEKLYVPAFSTGEDAGRIENGATMPCTVKPQHVAAGQAIADRGDTLKPTGLFCGARVKRGYVHAAMVDGHKGLSRNITGGMSTAMALRDATTISPNGNEVNSSNAFYRCAGHKRHPEVPQCVRDPVRST